MVPSRQSNTHGFTTKDIIGLFIAGAALLATLFFGCVGIIYKKSAREDPSLRGYFTYVSNCCGGVRVIAPRTTHIYNSYNQGVSPLCEFAILIRNEVGKGIINFPRKE
jgi:hypothetical protein